MKIPTPILKFISTLGRRATRTTDNTIVVETVATDRMADAMAAAYEAGEKWFVAMANTSNGKVEYKFSYTA